MSNLDRQFRNISKSELQSLLINEPSINREYFITLSTNMRISKYRMRKLVFNLSNRVNKRFCKQFRKKPHRQIKFYSFQQRTPNNTHSHVLLDIPNTYNELDVKREIESSFLKLDTRQKPSHPYRVYFRTSISDFSN